MVDYGKSVIPSQVKTYSPLNEGGEFKTGNYVTFRIGKGDMDMWLTNDSYLTFDIELAEDKKLSFKANEALTAATYSLPQFFIRNACNIFDRIEVAYDERTIYSQLHNIEQNSMNVLHYGESYLNSKFATYTTNKMIQEKNDYLKIGNSSEKLTAAVAEGGSFEVGLKKGVLIRNVVIPLNQLIPIFMDVTSDGFPLKCLKSQFEFKLYISDPNKYLCEYDYSIPDFSIEGKTKDGKISSSVIQNKTLDQAIKLTTLRLICNSYVPDDNNMADFNYRCEKGWMFKYQLWHIALRQISEISHLNMKLPFIIPSENTRSFLAYCYRNEGSASIMYRPEIQNLKLTFGSNSIPLTSPIGSTFTHPFNYKFYVEDVLDYIDNYHRESNKDFNDSYQYIEAKETNVKVPTSNFVLFGANFTNSQQLGANSIEWNSKYELEFNGIKDEDKKSLTFVLGVLTDYGLTIKDGNIEVINL